MNRRSKLIARFLTLPSDFHYNELIRLLAYYDFQEVKRGKTTGSRIKFTNLEGNTIMLHKPHPSGIMKKYQLKQIKEVLGL